MTLVDVAETWKPEPVEDDEIFDPSVGVAAAGLWDQPPPGETVPPLWHWFHFLEWTAQSRLGGDGHIRDGHFLPPVDDRRRMFAGGRWRADVPLRYGAPVHRVRSLAGIRATTGRTGELLFVTVRTELHQDGRLCVTEDQDIVYRSGPAAIDLRDTPLATGLPDGGALPLHTDETLLFRMSALTANPHRIHYDRPYVVDVEHYAGLVVHGPLLVLHLAEVLRRSPASVPDEIEYRLRAPAYVGEPLTAVGGNGSWQIASTREPAHATLTARRNGDPA